MRKRVRRGNKRTFYMSDGKIVERGTKSWLRKLKEIEDEVWR